VENVADQFAGEPAPDARAVLDTCLSVVSGGDLRTLLRSIPFAMLEADEALDSLLGAIQLQARLLDSNGCSLQVIRSTLHVDGEHAAAHCGFFSLSNPERPLAQQFHFRLLNGGWWWTPAVSKQDQTVLSSWLRQQGEDFRENWRDQLLDACPVIEELPDLGSAEPAAVRKLVKAWLDATRAGKIADALQLCARLKKDDSPQAVIRNLGYEVKGNSLSEPAPEITQVRQRGIWTAVSARTQQAGVMAFPIYPVIQTASGSRVLIEVDLFASTKRSREFLNETALERLDGLVPAAAIDDLRDLLNEHEQEVGAAEP
jgi:hypothetical protein